MASVLKVDKLDPQSGTALEIGTSGDTITIPSGATITNSGTATGFGRVLQVITATDSTARSTTSTSYATGSNTLAVTITPTSTSNKIFVMMTGTGEKDTGGVAYYTLYKDASNLGTAQGFCGLQTTGAQLPISMSTLDSPSSTSALVYQVYFKSSDGNTAYLNNGAYENTITCMEIEG
jgi:hypothetical protein